MINLHTCTRCGAEVPFEDVAYMGPVDRESDWCDPCAPFETVCKDCEE